MNVRSSRLPRRLAAGAGALLLVGALGACSSSSEPSPAASSAATAASETPTGGESASIATVLSEAAQASSEAQSAAFTLDLDADVTGGSTGDVALTANGSGKSTSDGKAAEVEMTLSVPQAGEYAIEAKVLDQTTFVKVTGAQIPGSIAGKWIKLDADTLGITPSPSASESVDAEAVAKLMAALDDATDVQEVGTEQVEGVDTTHYTATVDITELVSAAADAAGGGAQAQQLEQELAKADFDPVAIGVWVDGDKLVRKVAIDFNGTSSGTTVALTAEIVITDYDVPVEVAAPPAGEVVDGKQLMGSLGAMTGA